MDYLWYGIGAYLYQHPEIRYLIGPVSLSTSWPEPAQKVIASFYSELFGNNKILVDPRLPFDFEPIQEFAPFTQVADEENYKQAYAILKALMDDFGVKVPILYKQYVELCQPGGCEFLGFNIDPSFSNCVDALILVHINTIKEKKHQRYIESHATILSKQNSA